MNYSYSYSAGGAGAVIILLLMIAFYVLVVIGLWKTFEKAGHPGWAAIIPFYNLYIWIKIAGRPITWFWIMLVMALLMWIPIVDIFLGIALAVFSLLLALDVAKNFGQGTGFGVLLWLFSAIMYLVLGFGNYQYRQVAHPEMAVGYAGGQPMGQPMAPPPAGQYAPPAPGPAAQPMAPPPPLAQPLQPQPLAPPPAQAAPPTPPPTQAAPPTPPPAEAAPPTVPPVEPAPPESPTPPPPPPVS